MVAVAAGWYWLVRSRESIAVIVLSAGGFILLRASSRVRAGVERIAPDGYGAYRSLFILVFALAAIVLYQQASKYQSVKSPPSYLDRPTVQFGAPHAFPVVGRTKPTLYRYTVTVDPNNCQNPARVQVQLYVMPASLPTTDSPEPIGHVYLSVNDQQKPRDKSTIANVTIPPPRKDGLAEHALGVKPNYPTNYRLRHAFAHYLPAGTIISVDAGTWPISPTRPITVDFTANWVWGRSVGTCYVVLPTGGTNNGDPKQWAQPLVSSDRIVIGKNEGRGTVLVADSSSPPSDALIPQWNCQLNAPGHPDCSGYAVYAKPGAIDQATDGVFRFAAMLGVCLAIMVELLIQPLCEVERRTA
jgi:hypothetical protein